MYVNVYTRVLLIIKKVKSFLQFMKRCKVTTTAAVVGGRRRRHFEFGGPQQLSTATVVIIMPRRHYYCSTFAPIIAHVVV